MLVNCSEPVLAGSREAFLEAFAGQGASRAQLQTCYALAENVFAATHSEPAGALEISAAVASLEVGCTVELATDGAPGSRRLVSSGRTIETVGLQITDEAGAACPDGRVGEIRLSGPSVFNGYHLLPELTAPVLRDGWYRTGDLAFAHRGEVFVLGRQSDLLIVGGRKHYPNDIEHVCNEVPGVKEGRVVAFGVTSEEKGTQEVVVLAESPEHADPARASLIRREIKARAIQRVDCVVDRVLLLPPQTLIKTSSGKIARRDNRDAYQRGAFGA
jgi:acyl-CoA synthetase (AMP-forming)/AMP-acid ligase II